MSETVSLMARVESSLVGLGADPELVTRRNLPLYADADELEGAYVGRSGKQHFLVPPAAHAWRCAAVRISSSSLRCDRPTCRPRGAWLAPRGSR